MSTLPLISHARPTPVMSPRKSLRTAALLLSAVSSLCLAQEKGSTPAPTSLQAGQVQDMLATQSEAAESAIVGTWGFTRNSEDKEVADIETTIIVFNPDGSYTTRLRNNMFPDLEKLPMAGGRYAVTAANKAGFQLALERTSGDPEEDKATARSTLAVAIVDENTLRAPDGAVLTRLK